MWLDLLSGFLQAFLSAVLPVLASALAGLAIAWLVKVIGEIKSKLTDDQEWIIKQAIDSAVLAAEQVHLKDTAIAKKGYALQIAEKWLSDKGIHVDLAILDARIEAAVMAQFNLDKTATLPAVGFTLPASEPE